MKKNQHNQNNNQYKGNNITTNIPVFVENSLCYKEGSETDLRVLRNKTGSERQELILAWRKKRSYHIVGT
jgi:hypothetical protein